MSTGLRNTRQRQLLLEILQNTKTHPTADWLYQQVRQQLPNVSLGTIYRNLSVLKEQGVIQELRHAGSQCRYDGNPEPHYHFFCLECGKVVDVDLPHLGQMERALAESRPDFRVLGHNTEFYGLCPDCNTQEGEGN